MKLPLLTGAALALALAACDSGADQQTADTAGQDTMTVDPAATADASADAGMAATPQAFVDKASASDAYEIEAGKLAQANGTDQAIKDFGAMMAKDHTKSTADLKAAAGQVPGVTVNPKMTAKQQSDLEALRNAGEAFDVTYKQQQVAAHEQALAMLESYAANGDAQPLKDFAGKTAPVVSGHLDRARSLPGS